jgi:O-antigen/teichoic acid export membrane protein
MFGPGFEGGVTPLAVLVAGVVLQAAFGPAEDVLTMLGAERLCAGISLGALGVAAALNLALIPGLGPLGAALATASAGALRALALALAARRRLGLSTHVLSAG